MSPFHIHNWRLVSADAEEGPSGVRCLDCEELYDVVASGQWTGDPLDELCRQPHDFGHRWRIQFNSNDAGPVGIECGRCGLELAIVGAEAPIHYDDDGPVEQRHEGVHADHN